MIASQAGASNSAFYLPSWPPAETQCAVLSIFYMTRVRIKATAAVLADKLRKNPSDASSVIELCKSMNLKYRDFSAAEANPG